MRKKHKIQITNGIWHEDITFKKKIFGSSIIPDPGEVFENLSANRTRIFELFIVLITAAFLLRLFFLSVVYGGKNRDLADNNRIKLVSEGGVRGKIVTADGQVLAQSVDKYFLEAGGEKKEIRADQVKELERQNLAGVDFSGSLGKITKETARVYPNGEISSHITGYTSVVQKEDLVKNSSLSGEDFVGRLGVEEAYDDLLRGQPAKKIVEVDASGKTISILGETPGKAGSDIKLSIDFALQKKTFEVLASHLAKLNLKAGAVVVSEVQTGRILALVSMPSFDPADIGRFVTLSDKPLFNRAIAGTYPPGSVFKISSALAGLESGKINRDTQIEDVGEFELGGLKFGNWFYLTYGGRDGVLKIDRAIARSNDIFFFRLGEMVGVDDLRKQALALGFSQKTGIDLPGESYGLVPDEIWKKANVGDSWFLGDTLHMAIGQGFVLSTPIQINRMTDFVANAGKLVKPHLVTSVKSGGGGEIAVSEQDNGVNLVKAKNLDLVKDGMRQACETGGTGWPFFDAKYKVGCKTGTAEKAQGDPHAWFTAFAPFESPKVAITVIIENGGEGSSVAGPVAREILDWYFSTKQHPRGGL